MRLWLISILTIGLLWAGFELCKMMKFDTAVSILVVKGPFKGLSFKLVDYKVSYNDLQVKNKFWQSPLGKSIFNELSTTLQTLVLASKKYVDVQFEVNYYGLLRRHYKVVEDQGHFDVVVI